MKPPIIPNQGRGVDTINFRNVKESQSIDLGDPSHINIAGKNKGWNVPASKMKGVPLDSGLDTPGGELADPFEELNSVSLHHEDHGEQQQEANGHR